jgi:MSHA biogenesis protein MshG
MPVQFKYRAVSNEGKPREGIITAETADEVVVYLSQQNLMPIEIDSVKKRKTFSLWGFFKKTDYENLILFTNNLLTMYKAGIPLLQILTIMRIGPPTGRYNQAIQQIKLKVQAGKLLSQALEDYDDLFPRVYTSSIAAGEESGKLDEILEELAVMLEKEMELTRQIKAGIRYPLIVITAIIGAFLVLITYVVPKFVAFYGSFGAKLPLPTRILIGVSDFFAEYWIIVLVAVTAIVFGFKKLISTEKGKLWVDEKLLKLPIFGNLILKGNVASFTLMFRILFKSGLPIVKSLDVLCDSVKNSVIGQEIRKLQEVFREGKDTALTSGAFTYFPRLALQMIAIGLESGSLEKMLFQVGQHYSKEVQYTSRQLTSILEPILTLVLGVFVLILALAVFLPMWNLITVFKGS